MKYNSIIYRHKVRQYVRGLVSSEEKEALEKEIKDSQVLQELVAELGQEWHTIKEARKGILKEQLQRLDIAEQPDMELEVETKSPETPIVTLPKPPKQKEKIPTSKGGKRRSIFQYSMAACTVVLLFAFWKYFSTSAENLVNPLNNPAPAYKIATLGAIDDLKEEAKEFYDRKEFDEAAKVFSKLIEKNNQDYKSQYFWGVALLHDSNYKAAEDKLISLYETEKEHSYGYEVRYQLGLVYIARKDYDKAQKYLEEINRKNIKSKPFKEEIRQALKWIEQQTK